MAYFASLATSVLVQGLLTVRERVDQLEYILELEKTINVELVREINRYEETLREAQEKIDHRDDAVKKVEAKINDLEWWVVEEKLLVHSR